MWKAATDVESSPITRLTWPVAVLVTNKRLVRKECTHGDVHVLCLADSDCSITKIGRRENNVGYLYISFATQHVESMYGNDPSRRQRFQFSPKGRQPVVFAIKRFLLTEPDPTPLHPTATLPDPPEFLFDAVIPKLPSLNTRQAGL